ncbi:hypothetical protein PV433_18325 [Paenibacillus sp. GYB004]
MLATCGRYPGPIQLMLIWMARHRSESWMPSSRSYVATRLAHPTPGRR